MPRKTKLRQYRGATLKGAPRGAKMKSSVASVQLIPGAIIVMFKEHGGTGDEHVYVYTDASAGADTVEMMKDLAKAGAGLNRYINLHKPGYDPSPQMYGISSTGEKDSLQVNSEEIQAGDPISSFDFIQYFGD